MDVDRDLRLVIRAKLPPDAFVRRPLRALWTVPIVVFIATTSIWLVRTPASWTLAMLSSLALGLAYGALMFLGHEIAHGATVRSRFAQDVCLYPAFAIFLLSPHGWRVWHHAAHHGHANDPRHDPDTFGTLDTFLRRPRTRQIWHKLAPGSGHPVSALYLLIFFTVQAHAVMWIRSKELPAMAALNRRRVAIDTLGYCCFWTAVCWLSGPADFTLIAVIPMCVANFTVLSYVITNHTLRPLGDGRDSLATTMSVTTSTTIDRIHFYFSHHVEHHLFPSMPSVYYPLVRRVLQSIRQHEYVSPPHWIALASIFSTPRFYDGPDKLTDAEARRSVNLEQLATTLRDSSASSEAVLGQRRSVEREREDLR